MEQLYQKNKEAQQMIEALKLQIALIKSKSNQSLDADIAKLSQENKDLEEKIKIAKDVLCKEEMLNGLKQVLIPEKKAEDKISKTKLESGDKKDNPQVIVHDRKKIEVAVKSEKAKETNAGSAKGSKKTKLTEDSAKSDVVDVSKLDMRIGKILEVRKHDNADALFIEMVDVGESKPRQVISGLVKYCTEKDLLGRLGVFLLNLKPAAMRGVLSEGMIMCASAPDQGIVEPLIVPNDVKPGDRVTVEGYSGEPDDVLNPKKKIFETIKPDLRVNADGVATYKSARWQVNGEVGVIVSSKLKDVQIA